MAFQQEINAACRRINPQYHAAVVSWNDNARQQGSCWGSNITDARLKGKHGEDFVVVRPSNFDEKIGRVKASEVALLVGNHHEKSPTPTTLEDYLNRFPEYSGYATTGFSNQQSLTSPRDTQVGMRFQAVFLPADNGKIEFFPETYNYQTRSRDDPKNIVLLCTSQGTFVQQDGPGRQPQYLHKRNPATGQWENVFCEAMETRHGVSLGQAETQAERQQALAQGKAVSTVIGTRAMGLGFNRLMTIQIPLKQTPRPSTVPSFGGMFGGMPQPAAAFGGQSPVQPFDCFGQQQQQSQLQTLKNVAACAPQSLSFSSNNSKNRMRESRKSPGDAQAARVSYGTSGGPMTRLSVKPLRDHNCAITITVQFYFVVPRGKTVKDSDVAAAIAVCEHAYRGCDFAANLQSPTPAVDFAKDNSAIFPSFPPAVVTPAPAPNSTIFPSSPAPSVFGNPPEQSVFGNSPTPMPRCTAFEVGYSPEAGAGIVSAELNRLPMTAAANNWLHDHYALPLLTNQPPKLGQAYHAFRLVNDHSMQLTGKASASALYNMVCSLSLACEAQVNQYKQYDPSVSSVGGMFRSVAETGGIVAAEMAPNAATDGTVRSVVDQRLDAAIVLLTTAAVSGYTNVSHCLSDSDLRMLRECRRSKFDHVIALMHQ